MTFADLVERRADAVPDKAAIRFEGVALTYAGRAARAAAALSAALPMMGIAARAWAGRTLHSAKGLRGG